MVHPKSSKTNKKILLPGLLVVLVIGALFTWNMTRDSKTTPVTVKTVDTVNLDPPTEEEKQQAVEHKKELEDTQAGSSSKTTTVGPSPTTTVRSSADVNISYLSASSSGVEAGGYISNLVEAGGTCILTLTKGDQTVTSTSTGIIDVNKTTCPQISIPSSKLNNSGQWAAVLSYNSSKASGSSKTQQVNLP